MRSSIKQAAHRGLVDSCLCLMLDHAAVLYGALNACLSMLVFFAGAWSIQKTLPLMLWALH
jgi:hypothetical protein